MLTGDSRADVMTVIVVTFMMMMTKVVFVVVLGSVAFESIWLSNEWVVLLVLLEANEGEGKFL